MREPMLGESVHYRSYGTPGGEYAPRCRAAVITEVGAWVAVRHSDEFVDNEGRRVRDVVEAYLPHACALRVLNPTGDFYNVCERDRLPPSDRIVAGERTEHRGGHWHHVEECRT
ncbi:MAG: hypothetical protein H7Y15_09570 [Pseudonocardia sp.]|nr:hypothetical protein [Pseudonocardia sp.]